MPNNAEHEANERYLALGTEHLKAVAILYAKVLEEFPEFWYVSDGTSNPAVDILHQALVAYGFFGADTRDYEPNSKLKTLVERDGWECHYCHSPLGWGSPVVRWPQTDHVIPKSRGGSNRIDNLVPTCSPCNLQKGAKTPLQWLGVENICCEAHLEVEG